jgi:hypothetical protein
MFNDGVDLDLAVSLVISADLFQNALDVDGHITITVDLDFELHLGVTLISLPLSVAIRANHLPLEDPFADLSTVLISAEVIHLDVSC